jgi:hypothetical protein
MKRNFTVRQGALDGAEAFLSVARHRSFRRALHDPSRHQMMPKLRAFIDHVKSRAGATSKTRSLIDDKRTRGMKMR